MSSEREADRVESGDELCSVDFPVVGVGASAGGLEAFTALLAGLPPDVGAAIVLIQHLEPSHVSNLAEILQRSTPMPVVQVGEGMRLLVDHVYVIPPNAVMRLEGCDFKLTDRPKGRTPSRTIDAFMDSLAQQFGSRAIGVILSGAAYDGARGLAAIKAEGGITLVQDPAEAAYGSMPNSAIEAAVADRVLPVAGIAAEIAGLAKHPYLLGEIGRVELESGAAADQERTIDAILAAVQAATGVDLSHYKRPTLMRRIARRMAVRSIDSYAAYLAVVKSDPEEVEPLFSDLLVRVTSFFRDPGAFEALKTQVLPEIIPELSSREPVRVWVPGCATGQEPYSVLMLLTEYLESIGSNRAIQVFASDVREDDLLFARRGIYTPSIETEVTPERLERFFTRVESGYQVRKSVRDAVIFARHDVTSDPPFARLDLITCRNLLIYLDASLQRTLLAIFHYAISPGGALMLGEAEGVSAAPEFFDSTGQRGIFRRTSVKTSLPTLGGGMWRPETPGAGYLQASRQLTPATKSVAFIQRQLDEMLLERFSPAAMIVDEHLTILHIRGDAGDYLKPRPGTASLNLASMTSEGLASAIASAVKDAEESTGAVRRADLRVRIDGGYRSVAIMVAPLRSEGDTPKYAVMIEEAEPGEGGGAEGEVSFLEQELGAMR
jgi:two-component system CheB/CheR fusion protein